MGTPRRPRHTKTILLIPKALLLLFRSEIREDVIRIIDADPRVELISQNIFIADHAIRIDVDLNYILLNTSDVLYLDYIDEIQDPDI